MGGWRGVGAGGSHWKSLVKGGQGEKGGALHRLFTWNWPQQVETDSAVGAEKQFSQQHFSQSCFLGAVTKYIFLFFLD